MANYLIKPQEIAESGHTAKDRQAECAKISLVQISKSVEFLKSQFTLKWLLYVANDRRLFSQLTGGLHHTVFQLGSIRVHSLHWWDGLSLISS